MTRRDEVLLVSVKILVRKEFFGLPAHWFGLIYFKDKELSRTIWNRIHKTIDSWAKDQRVFLKFVTIVLTRQEFWTNLIIDKIINKLEGLNKDVFQEYFALALNWENSDKGLKIFKLKCKI